ncbi:DNA-directed RNA polymerase subunit delta [Tetragenococcus osmophilus]|uniref:Probable DNA-directed RNA polymerase subunit delta n=1 Tax=Tetragenococcus osmophilus TaxID=526944 RepID=A0AA37XJW7_9ENTE|nr:DNA-directed RNA polymerase subunit delta [Tetragenococcus osmophilus]AYW46955.1 DNA-directed RNA polymerase subunit delta [Tetragenococcus osmophilus]GMA54995.1 putative DNA-directed RNA polymerase subunit delta [Alicyclobacillus contaminans]GMA71219.1 putative DNA-directed RNA polymerase subunit delta [Tetragenococcus osmophilus]
MEIKAFENVNKSDLSMIEVAHAILEEKGEVMDFSDIVNATQEYLDIPDSQIRSSLAQFYTDLNTDGSFISLGENRWGLRSWYAIDSINEEVTHGLEDEEDQRPHRNKVNAFSSVDQDVIDYTDDDPEDADLTATDDDDDLFDDDDDDEEIAEYNSDLQKIGADNEEEEDLPGNIEEDLSVVDEDEEENTEENEDQA